MSCAKTLPVIVVLRLVVYGVELTEPCVYWLHLPSQFCTPNPLSAGLLGARTCCSFTTELLARSCQVATSSNAGPRAQETKRTATLGARDRKGSSAVRHERRGDVSRVRAFGGYALFELTSCTRILRSFSVSFIDFFWQICSTLILQWNFRHCRFLALLMSKIRDHRSIFT